MTQECTHGDTIHRVRAAADGCVECLETGGKWIHLRLCMECGHVGCCDQSRNKHASKHFHGTQHPIMKSFEPGEDWGWCFVDQVYIETDWPVDGPAVHSPAANAHLDW
jgi:ubiquitin-hydrolase Zn-finger-containing protein